MTRREDEGRDRASATPGSEGARRDPGVAGDAGAGPSDEEVRRRAYDLYQSRGGAGGSDVDDWLAAEREIRERHRAARRDEGGAAGAGASEVRADPAGEPSAAGAAGRGSTGGPGSTGSPGSTESPGSTGSPGGTEGARARGRAKGGGAPAAGDPASEGARAPEAPRTRGGRGRKREG